MTVLQSTGYDDALRKYLAEDRPYLGICLGMQTLFESSTEYKDDNESGDGSKELPGLGVIPGHVIKFDETKRSVPHIGWNGIIAHQSSPAMRYIQDGDSGDEVYFVHSYYAPLTETNSKWVLTRTTYEGQEYISSVQRGNVCATQFHPEKSGKTGLNFLKGFLEVSVFLFIDNDDDAIYKYIFVLCLVLFWNYERMLMVCHSYALVHFYVCIHHLNTTTTTVSRRRNPIQHNTHHHKPQRSNPTSQTCRRSTRRPIQRQWRSRRNQR